MSVSYLDRVATLCGRPQCGARIFFARTAAGKAMPLDLEPDPAGNVAVYVDAAGRPCARVVSKELPVATHEHLHVPHFATCGKPVPTKGQVVVPLYRVRARRRR